MVAATSGVNAGELEKALHEISEAKKTYSNKFEKPFTPYLVFFILTLTD